MNIDLIKEKIESCKGKELQFRFNGARNQTEEFDGTIVNTYPFVFLVRIEDDNQSIKSFSYSDVLMDHLEIKDVE